MLKMEKTAKKRPRTREKKPLQLRNKQGILKTRVGDSSAKTHVCGAAPHDFPAALKEQSYSSLKKLRMIFAHAADCDPDAQGRILIPADLRQKAGLNKEVIVVGSFDRVEIWDAQRWARMEEEAFSSGELQAAMEEMGL